MGSGWHLPARYRRRPSGQRPRHVPAGGPVGRQGYSSKRDPPAGPPRPCPWARQRSRCCCGSDGRWGGGRVDHGQPRHRSTARFGGGFWRSRGTASPGSQQKHQGPASDAAGALKRALLRPGSIKQRAHSHSVPGQNRAPEEPEVPDLGGGGSRLSTAPATRSRPRKRCMADLIVMRLVHLMPGMSRDTERPEEAFLIHWSLRFPRAGQVSISVWDMASSMVVLSASVHAAVMFAR